KEVHLSLDPGQTQRLKELKFLQELHWSKLDRSLKNRHLPSLKESVQARVRSKNGSWALSQIQLAGRNGAHFTAKPMGSIEIKVRAGELPYGLKHFRLYVLASKTYGLDMVHETFLGDWGLPEPRQDVVRVVLNGENL